MRRADLLRLAGITSGAFNALSARGLLPFAASPSGPGWGSYAPEDAFSLSLLADLVRAGQMQYRAAPLIRAALGEFLEFAGEREPKGRPYCFGILMQSAGPKDPNRAFDCVIFFELGSADAAIADAFERYGLSEGDQFDCAFVNATASARDMMRRSHLRGHPGLQSLVRLMRAS